MVIFAIDKDDQNESLMDPWSFVHGTSGLAFGLTGINFWTSISAAVIYDVLEQIAERNPIGQKLFATSGPESFGNVIVDLLLFAGGWWLGARYNATGDGVGRKRNGSRTSRNRNCGRLLRSSKRRSPRGERLRRGSPFVSRRDAMAGSIVP